MARKLFSLINILVITVGLILLVSIGNSIFTFWKNRKEIDSSFLPNTARSLPTPVQEDSRVDLCPKKPILPSGYIFQTPMNSFFGLSLKDGQGKICDVILGPNFKATLEGFSGEQIQINSYSVAKTTLDQLVREDDGTEISKLNNLVRYKRSSYGGDDQILIFKSRNSIIQLIWRESGSMLEIESVVLDLATQLK